MYALDRSLGQKSGYYGEWLLLVELQLYTFLKIIFYFICFFRWYHGKLDRADAESRLMDNGNVGSYLVRESDRKPGTFSLSYLGRNGVSHFRVTAVCGVYYIGGRQFDSLNDLIGYYTSWSCLLKEEHLLHPVPPPEPVVSKKRVLAKYTYNKAPDTEELR